MFVRKLVFLILFCFFSLLFSQSNVSAASKVFSDNFNDNEMIMIYQGVRLPVTPVDQIGKS